VPPPTWLDVTRGIAACFARVGGCGKFREVPIEGDFSG
jgi:hypothetical protein